MMIKENVTKSCDYLPYHFPTSSYSHYTCRVPKEDVDDFEICSCSRKLHVGENVCSICANSEIIKAAENGEIPENILHILKRIQCRECQLRFPDKLGVVVTSELYTREI